MGHPAGLRSVGWGTRCWSGGHSFTLATDCHFVPIEFFFHEVEGIVADLVVGSHGENCLTRGDEGCSMF